MAEKSRFHLGEHEIPKAWYNIQPDLPFPQFPPLHPGTLEPVTPDFLSVLFPMNLIMQEVSQDRYIEIPDPVRTFTSSGVPTPLIRARAAGKGARHAGAHLLQERRRQPGRIAQAEHRGGRKLSTTRKPAPRR